MRLGISDIDGLVHNFPRDYEVFGKPLPLFSLAPGKAGAAEGILTKEASLNFYKGMRIVNAYLSDMTGRLQLSWYNMPYIKNSLHTGVPYVFRGRVYEKNGRLLMYQPRVYAAEAYHRDYEGKLLPVYPLTRGVTNPLLQKTVREALKSRQEEEYLPEQLRKEYGLREINGALRSIHFPEDEEDLLAARRRLCFDEFFLFLLLAEGLRREREREQSEYRIKPDLRLLKFMADLPFSLTEAQQKAFREITGDMAAGHVMNRLLEGDVGSGKTIVALLAMLSVALNGCQAVLMAPTEVLARQHYDTVVRFLNQSELPVSALLLTGSMTQQQKRKAYERIRNHEADLIIGTHAVFQEQVEYHRLGLVVTDEQHRFGVAQRERLAEKGGSPHVLVMSATPIPRTLAIILYGDLDISVIDVLPSGRQQIKNCVVGPSYRNTAWKFIADEVKKGRQAYVVCPMIEKTQAGEEGDPETLSDIFQLENVQDYRKKLEQFLPDTVRTGVLHGRMSTEEKDRVMTEFKEGRIQVLITTTVVEVGVDVPNATVMMIENAERFGLAQLHQLRGRVGRGKHQSYCIMLNTSDSETARKRLDILNHSNDGFFIANQDLKLRGPGDIFGIRQSGSLEFHLADIYNDAELLQLAGKAVRKLTAADPELKEHPKLREKLQKYAETSRMSA